MNRKTKTKNYKTCLPAGRLITILGPTASGKTALSIKLAKKFRGEVISADSRQVYKGMDIGTAKITEKEMEGVPHHLLDIASPKRRFTVVQYKKLAEKALRKIWRKNKIPFLVGGTGFYIQAVVDGIIIPEVKPDWKLRANLEKQTTEELFKKLKKLDPRRAKSIDKYNRRRLIRALEIVIKTKKPVPSLVKSKPNFKVLIIGIKKSRDELKKAIRNRLLKRAPGIIAEIKKLRKSGVSWRRLEEFGLEYRFGSQFLRDKIDKTEMIEKIQKETEQFAKRQMTWLKRDIRIRWLKNQKEAEELIKEFLFFK